MERHCIHLASEGYNLDEAGICFRSTGRLVSRKAEPERAKAIYIHCEDEKYRTRDRSICHECSSSFRDTSVGLSGQASRLQGRFRQVLIVA